MFAVAKLATAYSHLFMSAIMQQEAQAWGSRVCLTVTHERVAPLVRWRIRSKGADSQADSPPVAVWVAVQHRAVPSREDRPATLVQLEPIRTAATRAANAAHSTARKYSNAPDSRQPVRPPAHESSWDDGRMPSGAASSGRRGQRERAETIVVARPGVGA